MGSDTALTQVRVWVFSEEKLNVQAIYYIVYSSSQIFSYLLFPIDNKSNTVLLIRVKR